MDPAALDVAALARRSFPKIPGVEIHPKPEQWYRLIRACGAVDASAGVPELSPEHALADLWSSPGAWRPDPDDLDLPENGRETIAQAFEDFGVAPPPWMEPPERPRHGAGGT